MNKLKNSTVYLAGPIDYANDKGHGWREKITPNLLEHKIHILNPCQKPPDVELSEGDNTHAHIDELKNTGQFHLIRELYGDIRSFDLRCCDLADFLIVYLNLEIYSCGTFEEITTANRAKKPVLVFAEGGRKRIPNWIFWMLPHQHLFDNIDDLLCYLKIIDRDGKDETKRWKLWARHYS